MALFKIHKGQSINLPKTYNEGYAYFTTDDGKFYIDTSDSADGRIGLNAFQSDKDRLGNIIDETYITTEENEIITGPAPTINADTLGGISAAEYALKSETVNINQGQENSGKYLCIGSNGEIYPDFIVSDNTSSSSGENGATFIPYVSADGVISWSNDKGLTNPESVNIKGPEGDTGEPGYTPIKGVDYWTADDKTQIVNDVLTSMENSGNSGGNPLDAYPVGSIYMSANSTSPASLFSGTWEQLTNRFLIGAGDAYEVEATGGNTSVSYTPKGSNEAIALTENQLPVISGSITSTMSGSDTGEFTGYSGVFTLSEQTVAPQYSSKSSNVRYKTVNMSFGGGATHNHTFTGTASTIDILNPYLAVYMWKRVA